MPRPDRESLDHLGDFTTTTRVLPIAGAAIFIGVFAAFVAAGLLKAIGFFTNLFFFQRVATSLVSPAGNHLGPFVIAVPIIGGLIVGLMARYGSDRIRGHGIPEAIEAILMRGSRVEPKVALLKPLSAAISIGSGGPFGAEGPIILTGGACGSLVAQLFKLTSAERKTLLVAGAAAGMSATFAAPIASVMLAVELLLFEWKPRSVIPVSLASVTAAVMRRRLIGLGPIFAVEQHPAFIGAQGLAGCVLIGLLAGALAAILTAAVYASEDAFERLPIHWMWWPAIGGVAIGIGGLIVPQALGVGYDVIGQLIQGDMPMRLIVGVLIVKSAIWAISLGSGTSGGVLAPLLMMGAALGGVMGHMLPAEGTGFWQLVAMGAMLAGAMRVPLTSVIFAVELTHDVNMLLPLLLAATIAYGLTVLLLRRSILTEKISRRGYHLSREYSIDPLEIIFAREVARTYVVAIPADATRDDVRKAIDPHGVGELARQQAQPSRRDQRLFPLVDGGGRFVGVVARSSLRHWLDQEGHTKDTIGAIAVPRPVVAYGDEPLRALAFRMAESGVTRFPVLDRKEGTIIGNVALSDLLTARARILEAEQRRERIIGSRLRIFGRSKSAA
jgi:CIC family chloride channel protein